MAKWCNFTFLAFMVAVFACMAFIAFAAPQNSDVSLEEFQRLDHASQRSYVYNSLNNPGFFYSPELMQKALHVINNVDWRGERLNPKDEALVDKFVKKVPMDMPAGRTVANRYFGKVSNKRFSITTGSGIQWNGELVTTPGGALLDPRSIPMDVARVQEIEGTFVFMYKPVEDGFEPAQVTLRKGELETGGMHDEITQPSRHAQFIVERGDVEIGGIIYHPDNGRIDALGDDNYKITDNNIHDNDPASVLMLGKNRDLKSDVEVVSKQSVTFTGGTRALFNQYSNGVLIDWLNIHAKGTFTLALSEFDKDEPFAEYTFQGGVLDKRARKVTPDETDSGVRIHYTRNGKRVVWDVDNDDFDEAPTGFPVDPKSGKPKAGEMRGENEQTPKEAPLSPLKKQVGKEVEKGKVEGKNGENVEKKAEKAKGALKIPGAVARKENVKQPLQPIENKMDIFRQSLSKARFGGEGQYEWDKIPADIQKRIFDNSETKKLSLIDLKSRLGGLRNQAERGTLGRDFIDLYTEFKRQYNQNNNVENWINNNVKKSWGGLGNSEFRVSSFGEIIIISDKSPGQKRVFIIEKKYRPLLDKLFY